MQSTSRLGTPGDNAAGTRRGNKSFETKQKEEEEEKI